MKLGDDLWAWVSEYPDGTIGLVAGMVPGLGLAPLVGRNEETIRKTEPMARLHARQTGQRVWLRRFTKAEDYPDVFP